MAGIPILNCGISVQMTFDFKSHAEPDVIALAEADGSRVYRNAKPFNGPTLFIRILIPTITGMMQY